MYHSVEIDDPIRLTGFYSFFCHGYESGYHFCGEMHDFWEVVCVRKGRLCATAADQVYDLTENDLIVHKPMEFHNLFVPEGQTAQVAIFSFRAQTKLEDELSRKVFALNEFQSSLIDGMFVQLDLRRAAHPHNGEEHWFLPYMNLFEKDQGAVLLAAGFVRQLLVSLLESDGRPREELSPDARVFRQAVDYLNTYLHKNVPVGELAKAVGVSTSGLNRLFRKYAGVSVHRYSLMQKIKTATQYLRDGITVTETARRLGFSNQSYFSACYKRQTGRNPSQV